MDPNGNEYGIISFTVLIQMEFPEQYFHFDACKEKEVPLRAFKLQHLLSTKHIFEKYISHLLTTHMQPHTFCA